MTSTRTNEQLDEHAPLNVYSSRRQRKHSRRPSRRHQHRSELEKRELRRQRRRRRQCRHDPFHQLKTEQTATTMTRSREHFYAHKNYSSWELELL